MTTKSMNATQYAGPQVGTAHTDEDLARLRASVPDDPIPLPADHAPCEGCGLAVHVPPPPVVDDGRAFDPRSRFDKPPPPPEPWALCEACTSIHSEADAYVTAHPILATRLGPTIARERIESVLNGLAILGLQPPTDIGLLLPRMHPVAHRLRFRNPVAHRKGMCNPYAYAHVKVSERADLRRAYVEYGRDRIAQSQPPVAVKCPSGGCVMCGINEIKRSALEVTRSGAEAVALLVWRPVYVPVGALGRPGPAMVHGHVCPSCDDAIDKARAVGQTAMSQAVYEYLRHGTNGDKRARRWAAMMSDDFPPTVTGWAATSKAPNIEPWSHLSRLIEDSMRTPPLPTFQEVAP